MGVKVIRGAPNLSARAFCLLKNLAKERHGILLVVKDDESFADFANAFASFKTLIEHAGEPEIYFWGYDAAQRARALKFLYSGVENGKAGILITTAECLLDTVMPLGTYNELSFDFSPGGTYPRAELAGKFQRAGYTRVSFVEGKGEFAVRGSVIDFFPPDSEKPVRLFFSDALDSVRYFDINTQATSDFLEKISVTPYLFSGEGGSVFELASGLTIFLDQNLPVPEMLEQSNTEFFSFSSLSRGPEDISFGAASNMSFNSDLGLVETELKRLKKEKYSIFLFCINRGETERLKDLFEEKGVADFVRFKTGFVQEGFLLAADKTAVLTSSEIFQRRYRVDMSAPKARGKFKWADLKAGDFIVHEDYGIGKYLGLKKVYYRNANNETVEDADCLSIEYARNDKLMVPLHEFNRVQKFISSEGKTPKLSHMDTKTWSEMKARVKEEIQVLAGDILKLEAERQAIKTIALPHAGRLEDEFSQSFPFEETPDQLSAIRDVLWDLEAELPMNRLVVGDVGFGKTEVAMRGAMRSVFNGRQAVILAPTTILADQHFNNFVKRFKEFPVKIGVISRFETKADQKIILKSLADGGLDIVIGTHRLLQKDVKFKNLGLLIIDEEHRFGVKDKEKLKAMAKGVHMLMLSATPIPRTLYQSLSALRTMSVIESAPVGRLPISTQVRPYDETALINAINYELARGGQIYYVHNRVRTIESRRAYLQRLMPSLRVAVVHGQMDGEQVEKDMWDFLHKKYDVLMASTIIESGLDIPAVNTMIVENAHELGLAQLYQLRGRIGREKQKAYCYLFYPPWMKKGGAPKPQKQGRDLPDEFSLADMEPESDMSETAMKRLGALEEFTELGSGLRLAMRDMEIRGAGELLGARQHGFINTIGLEMYIKLLNGEINRVKGKENVVELPEVKMDLELPAFIPEDYIGDDMERLNFYKKLLNADKEKVDKIIATLEDLSGPAPEPLKNLALVIKLKKELAILSVRSVLQKDGSLEVMFHPKAAISPGAIGKLQRAFGADLIFLPSKLGDGLKIATEAPVLETIRKTIFALS